MALILTETTVATRGETTTSYSDRCCTKARAEALNCTVTAPSDAVSNQLITGIKGNMPNLAVSMAGWTYGGTAKSPSVTGNTGGGTVTYTYKASSGTSSYSSTKPSNAGTYTVKASVAETTNYIAKEVTSTFTIAKATGSVTVTKKDLDSTGSAQALVSVSNQNTGTMHYRVGTSGSWSTSIPTATAAGTYTVYYYSEASTNYTAVGSSSSPKSVTSTIGVYSIYGPNSITLANGQYSGTYGFRSSKSGTYSPVTVSCSPSLSASAVQSSGINGTVSFSWSGHSGTDSITLTQTASGKTLTTTVIKN